MSIDSYDIFALEWYDDEKDVWRRQQIGDEEQDLLKVFADLSLEMNVTKARWRVATYIFSSAKDVLLGNDRD